MIYDIFANNIKLYEKKFNNEKKEKAKGKEVILSRSDINEYNARFHIIYHMYMKYGCPECHRKGCKCNVMPMKHRVVGNHICAGDPPWMI